MAKPVAKSPKKGIDAPLTPAEKKKSFREVFNERLDNETRLAIANVIIDQILDENLKPSERRNAAELIFDLLGEFAAPVEKQETQKIVLKIE